jgi:orotate phosphoribosyltransferase
MTPESMHPSLLELVSARQGHFRYESGYHGRTWFDLDLLFQRPAALEPYVHSLAQRLLPYHLQAICGPLVGGALIAQSVAAALKLEFFYTERVAVPLESGIYAAQYRLPPGLQAAARGKRAAVIDDVISAGSSVRATYHELAGLGAKPVVAGALLLLGENALPFFQEKNVAVEVLERLPFDMWAPGDCPMCAAQVPLEDPTARV